MPRSGDQVRWQVCPRCGDRHGDPGRCADGLGHGKFHRPDVSLADHLAWLESLGAKPCSCRFAWKSLSWREPGYGLHHGGYGWVRMNTDPRCPEHGADVRDARTGPPAAGVIARRHVETDAGEIHADAYAMCSRCAGPVDAEDRWCPHCMDYSHARRVVTVHLPPWPGPL
jgi:hypothetical protein